MKKAVFIIPTLICSISFGQLFSVSSDRENIAYIGLDNPITIAVENIPAKSVIVKTNNGKIDGTNGLYDFRPNVVGPAAIILYKLVNGKLKEIGRKDFRAKGIWDPVFKIGLGKDSISRKELQAQQYVRAELENTDYDLKFVIESFVVCAVSKDTCKYIETINRGNAIGAEMRELFSKLRIDDTIIFKEIICLGPDGKRKISPRIITVVE